MGASAWRMAEEHEYDDDVEDEKRPVVPHDLKDLRACLRCYLIKTAAQFAAHGCDNCEFLRVDEDRERLWSCTTSNFEGDVREELDAAEIKYNYKAQGGRNTEGQPMD